MKTAFKRTSNRRVTVAASLRRREDVLATGLGVKFTGGRPTKTACVVVFVKKKIAERRLRNTRRIPKTIRYRGSAMPTDVVEIGKLVPHTRTSLSWQGRAIRDRATQGTVAAAARIGSSAYLVSCAHAIWGLNQGIPDDDPIDLWEPESRTWDSVGTAQAAVYQVGTGRYPDFGIIDAGLVAIDDSQLRNTVLAAESLPVFRPRSIADVDALLHTHLVGRGAAMGERVGIVQAVLVQGTDQWHYNADIVLADPHGAGLTFPGDSGSMWFDQSGRAVAMHGYGDEQPPGYPSKVSIGTFAYRVESALSIRFAI